MWARVEVFDWEAPLVEVNNVGLRGHLLQDVLIKVSEGPRLLLDLSDREGPVDLPGLEAALNILQNVLAVIMDVHAEEFKALADGEDRKAEAAFVLTLDRKVDHLFGSAVVSMHSTRLPVNQSQVASCEQEAVELFECGVEARVVVGVVGVEAEHDGDRAPQLHEGFVHREDVLVEGAPLNLRPRLERLRQDADARRVGRMMPTRTKGL